MLDLDGYFDPLWAQIQRGIDLGFIRPEYLDLWYPAPDVDAMLRYLESYKPHGYGPKWSGRATGSASAPGEGVTSGGTA
jgi:hypothetical protein